MRSLIACLKKEALEGIRTNKFLIVGLGMLFFAIADPVMLKLMPMILENQFGSADPTLMKSIHMSQSGAVAKYANDLFQLGLLVMVFTLSGLISGERENKTLTIPVSMGYKVWAIILGKWTVYGVFTMLVSIVGMLTATYYGSVLFGGGEISVMDALKTGAFEGLLFVVVLNILLFASAIANKGFIAGIGTLLLVYLMAGLGSLFRVDKYLPTNLSHIALSYQTTGGMEIATTLLCTSSIIVLMSILTIGWLNRIELT